MKKVTALSKNLLLLIMTLAILSCSNDDDNNDKAPENTPETITELAVATPNLSSLVAALQKANLAQTLDDPGNYTVFAPTNAAFDAFLSANNFASLDDVPVDVLTQVLLNHVIDGEVKSTALTTGYVKTLAKVTLDDKELNVSMFINTSGEVLINGVSKPDTANLDIDATNGVIHIVDAVIGLPNIVDHALANPSLTSLVAALSAADGDLVNVLKGDGPFTVLAPLNDGFTEFLDGAALSSIPTDDLAQVLLNHVLSGATLSTDLVNAVAGYTSTKTKVFDDRYLSLYFDTTDGVKFNGKSTVQAADIVASNGIIHAVDKVIGLPTVVDFATSNPNFSSLVAALTREASFTYVATLSTANGTAPAPFTVFAPTDMAFTDLLTELGAASLADIDTATLEATLNHHVVAGANVVSSSLMDNMTVTTLGGDITANVTGGATLTDANNRVSNIDAVDVQAANGVIHVINKVVLPPLQ